MYRKVLLLYPASKQRVSSELAVIGFYRKLADMPTALRLADVLLRSINQEEEPDDWFTSNVLSLAMGEASVTKSTDSYEGTYAIRIENKMNFYEDTLGFITNGTMGEDNPIGGMPIDSTPDKVTGYYKYMPGVAGSSRNS